MMSEWKEVQFSELCTVTRGASPRPIKDFISDEGMPWVKIADATSSDSRFIEETKEKIKLEGVPKSKSVYPGDLILSNSATPGLPKFMKIEACIHDGWMLLKDFKGLDKRFAYWLLLHERKNLVVQGNGSVFTNLKTDILKNHIVKIPAENKQIEIAEVLDSVQEKIELNRQTNQTLEQIAQAIFKSWFVDFEPVKAKIAALEAGGSEDDALLAAMQAIAGNALFASDAADADAATQLARLQTEHPEQYTTLRATAELFPSAMQESELGEIPEGWEPVRLEHYIELAYGKALKKTDRVEGPYRVYGSGGITGTHNDFLVQGPSIILGRKGTIGSIYWENQNFYPIDTTYYVIVKNGCTLSFAYYLLQTLGLKGMNTDAAVPGLNRNNVYRLETPCYPKAIIDRFTEMATSNFSKIANCNAENLSLVELRDTLLPKLLSGELSVSAAADQITQAEEAVNVQS